MADQEAGDISSGQDDTDFVTDVNFGPLPEVDAGAEVDKQVTKLTPITGGKDNKTRSGPPTLDEWQHFFSRVVIRMGTKWYADNLFEDIEDLIPANEAEKIALTDEECDIIGKPLAEFANKLKFTRKYGRVIISGAGSFESVVILGRWFARVNRIANKYKTPRPSRQQQPGPTLHGEVIPPNGNNGPQQAPPTAESNGTGFRIFQPGTGA